MALTYARIAAIPLLCFTGLSSPPQYVFTTGVFAAASFTDFLDGYLARKWSVVSPMGTFLDPVADKLMVAAALTLITARIPHPIIILATATIVSREIFVSALREWMALLGKSANVKVSFWGKLKTTMQMVAVTLLLLASNLSTWYSRLGLVFLAVAAILSVVSASDYVFSASRALKQT